MLDAIAKEKVTEQQ